MAETTICWWEEEEYGGRAVQEERGRERCHSRVFWKKEGGSGPALRCAALGGTEVGGKLR